ncbi:MAG TPA: aldo/keto reductase [Burkholderiaceae bacterium]|nr:aldo/keto reductase [Burkholderiaceae bacterium]
MTQSALPTPRTLAGRPVHPIGLGCMGMSEFYGASDDAESLATLHAAVELGVTHFDSADTYGHGHNESLLGRFLKEVGAQRRDTLTIATKFGIVREPGRYERRIDNSPTYVRSACEASLKRLGVDCIDLYYCHRRDPDVPIAEVVGAMASLVAQGKVRSLGLSEVSLATLQAAHAVHPIAALQSEFSLWARDLEAELLPATQAMGTAVVAYSPLGRGMLTGTMPTAEALDQNDFRRALPRFTGSDGEQNRRLIEELNRLAKDWGIPATQIALAWTLHKGPQVLPIPGARRQRHLEQNVASAGIALSAAQIGELEALFAIDKVRGERYPQAGWAGIEARR